MQVTLKGSGYGTAIHTDPLLTALLDKGLLTKEALDRLDHIVAQTHTPLSSALTRLGLVSERELAEVYAELLHIPIAERGDFPENLPLAPDINPLFLRTKRVLPLRQSDNGVDLAMADPYDLMTAQAVSFVYGRPVRKFAALETDIDDALSFLLTTESTRTVSPVPATGTAAPQDDVALLTDHASEAPVIRLVNRWIPKAVELGASDIHIEPGAQSLAVRFRVDGRLHNSETLSKRWADPLASRIKLMAKLDIAEKRLPQDGRIRASVRGRPVDLRVATFPGLHGESVVLRILGQLAVELDLEKLELLDDSVSQIRAALAKPHGIILITGPTGSGKTTTLYAALNAIRSVELKLVTVEDPVEYTLPGVSQLQVKPDIGLTYAAALRTILRNDPDVIMIGEIRDKETADIAVRAALTGHLVLATLHTNTAAGAITRLLDLGIDDFLLSATLILSGAQRLVRKLCLACAQPCPITEAERDRLLLALPAEAIPEQLYEPVGCSQCLGRGYAGRTPLFEAISINDQLQEMIRADFDERAFSRAAYDNGTAGLWRHGMEKVAAGVTTLDEAFRVIGAEGLCASSK